MTGFLTQIIRRIFDLDGIEAEMQRQFENGEKNAWKD